MNKIRNGNNNNSNDDHVPDSESLYRWKGDACKYSDKYQKLFDIERNPNVYQSPHKQTLNNEKNDQTTTNASSNGQQDIMIVMIQIVMIQAEVEVVVWKQVVI